MFANVLVDLTVIGDVCGDSGSLPDFSAFLDDLWVELPEFPYGELAFLGCRPNFRECFGGFGFSCSSK